MDATDNWHGTSTGYLTKTNGTTDLNQNRTNNKVNEITDITESVGPAWTTPAYDRNGNATSIPQPGTPTSSYSCTYDAWDRAVTVGSSTNRYDGLNRRVTKDTGTVRHYYYSHQWQILEERTGSSTTADRQFMWGMRYLDDLVVRERTTGSERSYALHDYFNCTAIVDTSGAVQERYGYDAYGKVRFMTSAFASRSSSSYDWETLYAAYRWDSESGLYQVRNRYLHAKLGVWLLRMQTIGVIDSYTYVSNRAVNEVTMGEANLLDGLGLINSHEFPVFDISLPTLTLAGFSWPKLPPIEIPWPQLPPFPRPPKPPPITPPKQVRCSGYLPFICSTCDGKKDPYPAAAYICCQDFMELYDCAEKVQCVANCLQAGNAECQTEDSCEKRKECRKKNHVDCYSKCKFIPTKGVPLSCLAIGLTGR